VLRSIGMFDSFLELNVIIAMVMATVGIHELLEAGRQLAPGHYYHRNHMQCWLRFELNPHLEDDPLSR
jgi:hypothetical protein